MKQEVYENKLADLMNDLQVVKTNAGREAINAHINQLNEVIMKENGLLSACTCEEQECCPDCSPDEN
ncbi:hypothetical protein SMD22_00280 (plasmid) [Brevibacillus halotolerans]|nr:hypothetical protein SMD22_00280 [Brevibacillus halotolerans]